MLHAISAIHGYAIEASDGPIGTVHDVLFDDFDWKVRWLVVDTGSWLRERKVLIHPTAVIGTDHHLRRLQVNLTKAQVEGSLDIDQDLPVSRQLDHMLSEYYALDPMWNGISFFDAGAMVLPGGMPVSEETAGAFRARPDIGTLHDDGDPHLRSIAEVTGYDLHAQDGDIGHVENFLFDDADWILRYLVVDTRNWWPGKHVLLSPHAVTAIDWPENRIDLGVTREQVRSAPEWDPVADIDRAYEMRLHHHYGWRGHGW